MMFLTFHNLLRNSQDCTRLKFCHLAFPAVQLQLLVLSECQHIATWERLFSTLSWRWCHSASLCMHRFLTLTLLAPAGLPELPETIHVRTCCIDAFVATVIAVALAGLHVASRKPHFLQDVHSGHKHIRRCCPSSSTLLADNSLPRQTWLLIAAAIGAGQTCLLLDAWQRAHSPCSHISSSVRTPKVQGARMASSHAADIPHTCMLPLDVDRGQR